MNFLQRNFKKLVAGATLVAATAFVSGAVFAAVAPGSVQYQGVNTPGLPEPSLNAFYDVPSVGNEADFVRVKKTNEANSAYRNSVDTVCTNGDTFNVWLYVHNGAVVEGNNNGTGPSVAKDVKARVDLGNSSESDRFDIKGFLTSSNAGNINDGAVIDCGDKKFKLSYVDGSAKAFLDLPNSTVNVPSAIIAGGTAIGTTGLDGNVWGCWEQRVWMNLIVVVEEVKEPEVKVPAVCDLLKHTLATGRQVIVNDVQYTANDAVVNNIALDFGDGNSKVIAANKSELPYTHTYAKDGTYTVRATLNTTFEGNTQNITRNECAKEVTVKENDQPNPAYSCDNFKLTMNNRNATASFVPTAVNGATFKDATVRFLADGVVKNEVTTNKVEANGTVVTTFTYASGAKNVEARAVVRFNVNNEVKEVTCGGQSVLGVTTTPPATPTVLPDTGAGSVAGILVAVAAIGAYAHRALTLKRQ